MPPISSNLLKLSSLQDSSLDVSLDLKSALGMANVADDDRAEIVFRLNLLPNVLGRAKGELGVDTGGTASDWSNWIKEDGTATIPRNRALELYRVHGITMEWLYGGYLDTITNPKLRRKIREAERTAPPRERSRAQFPTKRNVK